MSKVRSGVRSRRTFGRAAALGALVAGAALVMVGVGESSASAATTMVVHVKVASLDQSTSCGGDTSATGAHFVITSITPADAPDSVSVTFSDNSTADTTGAQHHANESGYDIFFASGLSVTDATAVVPATWTGEFVLSHYICGGAPSTTPATTPATTPNTFSISASSSTQPLTTVVTESIAASSSVAPIPAAVSAGRHTPTSLPLAFGGALIVLGLGSLLALARPRGRRT